MQDSMSTKHSRRHTPRRRRIPGESVSDVISGAAIGVSWANITYHSCDKLTTLADHLELSIISDKSNTVQ